MSSLALYRKYRSADFDEVVGQKHVVETLKRAIKDGKQSHAYLLTGPRGVGKTTIARLIAKEINQLPKGANLSDYLDIIEIDGASNRGIDEIRDLKDKIRLSPAALSYKVYIIDEVHMLTKEAFNALLKTLEEPPAHAVFIFATTEVHKLPETIISRTQRFDLRPINRSDMVGHLRFIADKEKIKIDDAALAVIARVSRGGFRDAISLLDQLSSYEGAISVQVVSEFTGLIDAQKIEEILELMNAKKAEAVIAKLNELFEQGADPAQLTQQMLELMHQHLLEGSDFDTQQLFDWSQQLYWVQKNLRHTGSGELLLQVALGRPLIATGQADSQQPQPVTKTAPKAAIKTEAVKTAQQPKSAPQDTNQTSDEKLLKSLSVIKHYNNSLYAVLKGAEVSVEGDEILVRCRFSFHRDRIAEPRNQTLIEKAFSKVYGSALHLRAVVDNPTKTGKINSSEELISSAIAILGGEVVDG